MIRRWAYLKTDAVATIDPRGAALAVQSARGHLADEQRRTGRTTEVSERLRELQSRNHFAELLEQAMTPQRKPRGT